MTLSTLRVSLVACLCLTLISCASEPAVVRGPVEGSGVVLEDVRALADFTSVDANGPIDVQLKASSADKVVVSADDNIVPLIQTQLKGDTLVIGLAKGALFRTRNRLLVTVEFRELSGITTRGSGELRADNIKAALFDATVRGSGNVTVNQLQSSAATLSVAGGGNLTVAGVTTGMTIKIEGAGNVLAEKLVSKQAAVRIQGSGSANVNAAESLQAFIAGSGNIRYVGSPQVAKIAMGSGQVMQLQ